MINKRKKYGIKIQRGLSQSAKMFSECEIQYSLGFLVQAFTTEDKETNEVLDFKITYNNPGILLEPGCIVTIHKRKYCLKSAEKIMSENNILIQEIRYIFVPID